MIIRITDSGSSLSANSSLSIHCVMVEKKSSFYS